LAAITWITVVKAIRDSTMNEYGGYLLLMFGGVATAALVAGALFARHITKPIAQVVTVANRVGGGGPPPLVALASRDEVSARAGAGTVEQAIVRMGSEVQTETERDEERRKRQELQQNIARFLHTVMEISQGDLTKRGVVTSDVLGNVVEGVNLMVEQLATII